MIDAFRIAAMQLPTARDIVGRAVNGLAQGLNQIVLCPDVETVAALTEAARVELLRRDFSISGLYIPELEGAISLECALLERLAGAARRSAEADIGGPRPLAQHDVLVLEGLENLPDASQQRWFALLARWNRGNAGVMHTASALPALFCAARPVCANLLGPFGDVSLKMSWWWGTPSGLECRLLCRSQGDGRQHGALNAWREAILPSLAGGDISLLAELWPRPTWSREDIWAILNAFGESRGWTADVLNDLIHACRADHLLGGYLSSDPCLHDAGMGPPEHLQPLWLEGLLHFTPEQGTELHTAALTILGQGEAVNQRLWRAEAALVLPMLDAHRQRICRNFTMRYGDDWPLRWQQPVSQEEYSALQESPLACQWGHLETLLKYCPALARERKYVPFVKHCRRVRNKLAHCEPIDFTDFKRIWDGARDVSV